ncbi:Leucyl-tRNA synthetase [uncultured virus]|nr:Leucyl-tRNA synthetase [uncultured virus]
MNKSNKLISDDGWIKRDKLIEDEKIIQTDWNLNKKPTIMDHTKPKFMVTFPIPYLNGTLHLGHAYTISKVDFYARYKKLCGFNVLFPQAFHATGMPIVSCAKKIKEELKNMETNNLKFDDFDDNSQIKILIKMNVNPEQLYLFEDPYHWITYFNNRAIEDLTNFGTNIDFTRTFITTDKNPYFDSFVKWQFNILKERKYLIFGKKLVIYSLKDNQPCSDHDRSIGEGVGIKDFLVIKLKIIKTKLPNKYFENTFFSLIIDSENEYNLEKVIYIHKIEEYVLFEFNKCQLISSKKFFDQFKYQIEEKISKIDIINVDQLDGSLVSFNDNFFELKINCDFELGIDKKKFIINREMILQNNLGFLYYKPQSKVISRSGDECIVALVDQWFINYKNEFDKKIIEKYINTNLTTNNPIVEHQLLTGSNWLSEWPCSRSYGLGTKLLETDYVIDSLSDSTIYMAFYTICHEISNIPIELIDDNLWHYIFFDSVFPEKLIKFEYLLNKLKNEFNYWYPLDLRISGKDLINNHLVMSLYNHLFVWNDIKFLPKSYFANGHLLLNGDKMSKHTGNFMTLEMALKKFGSDSTRIALAMAGSGINDANFDEINARDAISKLTNEKEWCLKMINEIINNSDINNMNKNFWDELFENELNYCLVSTTRSMDQLDFQKAITSGFFNILNSRDKYRLKYEKNIIQINYDSIRYYLQIHLILLQPFCPYYCNFIFKYAEQKGLFLNNFWPLIKPINEKYIWYQDGLNYYTNKCRSNYAKLLKKKKNLDVNQYYFEITIYPYCDKIYPILQMISKEIKTGSENEIYSENQKDKSFFKGINYIKSNLDKYSNDFQNLLKNNEEVDIIQKWLPIILNDVAIKTFDFKVEKNDTFSYLPWKPKILLKIR